MNKMRLMATRYDNKTLEQLSLFREKNPDEFGQDKAIYCAPIRIKESIPVKETLMVIEMNNDTNQVIGLGLIKNYVWADKKYKIYEEMNYARYIYKGKYRIPREKMSEQEEIYMKIFDVILFKGKTHLKRGQGLTEVPEKLYKHIKISEQGLMDLMRQMFRDRFALPKTSSK